MALDERVFFNERPEQRNGRFPCPRCRRTNDYQLRWVRRTKKDRVPGNADEGDRAKFAKLRDHLIRVDDELTCKTCGKRFEIPSMHSLVFVDQIEGLPRVDEDEDAGQGLGARGPEAGNARPTAEPAAAAQAPVAPAPPRQRKGYAPPKAWK